ncbi:zinc knuckle-domain-containing protein [Dichotomocladium elegans]|nr:zinc knuckle-domain-containing protein [Dichotomocladium elegans]
MYRTGARATLSTRCQRCLDYGHWTYECKNNRPYKSRPTRTQQLSKPLKLREPELPDDLLDRKGLADKILAKKKKGEKRRFVLCMSDFLVLVNSLGPFPTYSDRRAAVAAAAVAVTVAVAAAIVRLTVTVIAVLAVAVAAAAAAAAATATATATATIEDGHLDAIAATGKITRLIARLHRV